MPKLNCWEYMRCERGKGGAKAGEMGVCPASTVTSVNGLNGGKNGGRTCWVVSGTLCDGKIQDGFSKNFATCMVCDFYKLVVNEESTGWVGAADILRKLQKSS